jgi:hypothetical protein
VLLVDPAVERIAQLGGEPAGLVVAGRAVGRDDHRAEVAQVELIDIGQRAFGTVTPFRPPHRRPQLLGQLHERAGIDLRAALGGGGLVLLVERRPHRRQPTPDQLLGDGPLLLGQLGDERVAVLATGPQALGPWLGIRRRAPLERPAGTIAAVAAGASIAVAPGPATVAAVASVAPIGAVAAIAPVAAAATVVTPPAHQARGHQRIFVAPPADDLQPLWFASRGLRRCDGGHDDALDVDLDLGLEHHADVGITREQGTLDAAAGFPGAGGSPGPGAVIPTARQLDIDATRHGTAG